MFFNLINDKHIKSSAYKHLLSLCDKATFLYTDYKKTTSFEDVISTCEHSNILNDLVHSCLDTSWGMSGIHYTFSLSNNVKNLITEIGLDGIYYITKNQLLENLTLLKDNKIIYSTCSHEAYEDIETNFRKTVTNFCLKEIQKTNIYKTLLKNYKNLIKSDLKALTKYLTILERIDNYVREECNYFIRQTPPYKTTYKKFLNISKKIFTKGVFNKLNKVSCFKDLHPDPNSVIQYVPQNLKELSQVPLNKQKHFTDTPLYKEIQNQVYLFKVVEFLQTQKIGRNKNTFPSIIINKKV